MMHFLLRMCSVSLIPTNVFSAHIVIFGRLAGTRLVTCRGLHTPRYSLSSADRPLKKDDFAIREKGMSRASRASWHIARSRGTRSSTA
ncbi:hypothetical protein F4819DRAFT_114699 [Hypoxylon fuscum]|nr:hypothetical protein F4819DRAFT_114699 [Hypoxylon fuscum]